MLVEFSKLNKNSRIWIFQSVNEFSESTTELIKKEINTFLENWESHQKKFESSVIIKYNTFIIVAADDTNIVSGCSIDSLIKFIKSLEKKYEIELLDKLNIKYRNEENIDTAELNDFKKICKNLNENQELIVFNNLVSNIHEFEKNWEVDIRISWHKRFLKNV